MDEWVVIANVGEEAATVGHKALYPGERRRVRRGVARYALQFYPKRLVVEGEAERPANGEAGERLGGFVAEGEDEVQGATSVIGAGEIKGIGPKWAERLATMGIGSVDELAGLDDEGAAGLLEAMGGALTLEQLMDWVVQARERV